MSGNFGDDLADIFFECEFYNRDLVVKFIGRVMPQDHHGIFVGSGSAKFHRQFAVVVQKHC